jgi:hypothetical protein
VVHEVAYLAVLGLFHATVEPVIADVAAGGLASLLVTSLIVWREPDA